MISYIGYGNEETQWVTELKPSQGDAARNAQTRKAEEEEGENPAGDVAADESKGATQVCRVQKRSDILPALFRNLWLDSILI